MQQIRLKKKWKRSLIFFSSDSHLHLDKQNQTGGEKVVEKKKNLRHLLSSIKRNKDMLS